MRKQDNAMGTKCKRYPIKICSALMPKCASWHQSQDAFCLHQLTSQAWTSLQHQFLNKLCTLLQLSDCLTLMISMVPHASVQLALAISTGLYFFLQEFYKVNDYKTYRIKPSSLAY